VKRKAARRARENQTHRVRCKQRELTLGKREAISVTAEWIFSEHGTKLKREMILLLGQKND